MLKVIARSLSPASSSYLLLIKHFHTTNSSDVSGNYQGWNSPGYYKEIDGGGGLLLPQASILQHLDRAWQTCSAHLWLDSHLAVYFLVMLHAG